MPVTSSAQKALRRDRHRTQVNRRIRTQLKTIIDQVLNQKDAGTLPEAYSVIDRAAKNSVIHPNKAARLKSNLSKATKPTKKSAAQSTPKKTPKKTSAKKIKKTTKKTDKKK